jgi:hypothetical protein
LDTAMTCNQNCKNLWISIHNIREIVRKNILDLSDVKSVY